MARIEDGLAPGGMTGVHDDGGVGYRWRYITVRLRSGDLILAECPVCYAITLESMLLTHTETSHGSLIRKEEPDDAPAS